MEKSSENMMATGVNRERELFLTVAAQAYCKSLIKGDDRPTQYDIAELLRMSRAGLNRNMTKYQTSWSELGLIARGMWLAKDDCSCLPQQLFLSR